MRKVKLFGFDFISSDAWKEIVTEVLASSPPKRDLFPLLITPNVDQIVKLSNDDNKHLKEQLQKAMYVLPDGQPIVTLSKIKYKKKGISRRLTGADFFIEFWTKLKETEHRILLVVPSPEVGEKLKHDYPFSSFYCPPFFKLDDQLQRQEIIRHLQSHLDTLNPRFLIIGLGFPKQESIFMDLFHSKTKEHFPLTMLLGASFEFYTGAKKRAPLFMRKMGLEFLHRFYREPKRMFKRYFVDDLKFFPLAIKELRKKD